MKNTRKKIKSLYVIALSLFCVIGNIQITPILATEDTTVTETEEGTYNQETVIEDDSIANEEPTSTETPDSDSSSSDDSIIYDDTAAEKPSDDNSFEVETFSDEGIALQASSDTYNESTVSSSALLKGALEVDANWIVNLKETTALATFDVTDAINVKGNKILNLNNRRLWITSGTTYINVTSGATLTVQGSGSTYHGSGARSVVYNVENGGTLNLYNSVEQNNASYNAITVSGTLNLYSGKIRHSQTSGNSSVAGIYVTGTGKVNIEGGSCDMSGYASFIRALSASSSVKITGGGNFYTTYGSLFTGVTTGIKVSGGIFKGEVPTTNLEEGYKNQLYSGSGSNGYYKVVSSYVAKNTTTSTGYTTLKSALEAAQANQTIQLIQDCSSSDAITITNSNITLDLNGHTSSNGLITVNNNGGLIVTDSSENKSGVLTNNGNNSIIKNTSSFTLNAGSLTDTNGSFSGILTESGTVTINGGSITSINRNISNTGSSVTITGGTFKTTGNFPVLYATGNSASYTINETTSTPTFTTTNSGTGAYGLLLNESASATISAGTFTTTKATTLYVNSNASATVSGGSFASTTNTAINNGTLTISNGSITSSSLSESALVNKGTLTISGGSIKSEGNGSLSISRSSKESAILMNGGTATITGGELSSLQGNVIYIDKGTINISNTESTSPVLTSTGQYHGAIYNYGGVFNISGGKFSSTSSNTHNYSSNTVTITGGKFNKQQSGLSSGYVFVNNEDNDKEIYPYKVSLDESKCVAQVTYSDETVKKYFTLNVALNEAPKDSVVQLLDLPSGSSYLTDTTIHVMNKNVTLDLNGKNITLTKPIYVSGELTVLDTNAILDNTVGSITSTSCNLFETVSTSTVNTKISITSGTFTSSKQVINSNIGTVDVSEGTLTSNSDVAIKVDGSNNTSASQVSLNVTGGTITGSSSAIQSTKATIDISDKAIITNALEVKDNSIVNLKGGSISSSSNNAVIVNGDNAKVIIIDGSYSTEKASSPTILVSQGSLIVRDGNFSAPSNIECIQKDSTSSNASISISGGKYTTSQTDYLDEGYSSTSYTDDLNIYSYQVTTTSNVVAKIGDTNYDSLSAAITAAQAGDTVTLLKDTSESSAIEINKNITLDLNNHIIHPVSAESGVEATVKITGNNTVVTIKNGTIEDSLVLNENGDQFAISISEGNALTLQEDENSTTSIGTITTSGSLTVSSGTTGIIYSTSTGTINVSNGFVEEIQSLSTSNSALSMSGGLVAVVELLGENGSASINGGAVGNVLAGTGAKLTVSDNADINELDMLGSDVTVTGGNIDKLSSYAESSSLAISGGTFGFDPTSYIKNDSNTAVSKLVDENGNVTYSTFTANDSNVEALINEADGNIYSYTSLQQALTNCSDGAIITVSKDSTVSNSLTISNKSFTLDLNGKTITLNDVLTINEDNLFITDSNNTKGKIILNKENAITISTGSTFIMENGSMEDGTSDNGSLLISEGAIGLIGNGDIASIEKLSVSGTLTINENASIQSLTINKTGNVTISYGYVGSISKNDNATLSITGGSFGSDPSSYLSDNYYSYKLNNTYYVDTIDNAIVSVTTNSTTSYYHSLKDAIEGVSNNSTIKLLKDSTNEVGGSITESNVILDLNGKSISLITNSISIEGGSLTVKDSSDERSGSITSTVNILEAKNNATLTVNNGSYESNRDVVYASGSTVTINDGTYLTTGYNKNNATTDTTVVACVYGEHNANITINNGVYKIKGNYNFVRCVNISNSNENEKKTYTNTNLTINGGTFTSENTAFFIYGGYAKSINITGGRFACLSSNTTSNAASTNQEISTTSTQVNITGGKFRTKVTTNNYIKSGYTISANTDSDNDIYKWIVGPSNQVVATLTHSKTTTNYYTLDSAISGANTGDTVTLQQPSSRTTTTNINKSITFDLGNTTMDSSVAGSTLTIMSNSVVTLKNGYLHEASGLDGNGSSSNDYALLVNAGSAVTVGNGTDGSTSPNIQVDSIKTEGTLNITKGAQVGDIHVSNSSGTVSITGGTITGSINNNGGTVSITGGTFTTFDPTSLVGEGYKVRKEKQTDGSYHYTIISEDKALVSVTSGEETPHYYQSLRDAFGNAQDGDLITILKTFSNQDGITSSLKNITLDLNDIDSTINSITLKNGSITVKDSKNNGGTLNASSTSEPVDLFVLDNSTITVESGTLKNIQSSTTVSDIDNNVIKAKNGSIVNMNGGSLITTGNSSGGIYAQNEDTTVNFSAGTIKVGASSSHSNRGISAKDKATLNMTGGTIETLYDYDSTYNYKNGGKAPDIFGIYLDDANATITNGTITSKSGYNFHARNSTATLKESNNGKITFTTDTKYNSRNISVYGASSNITIESGTYTKNGNGDGYVMYSDVANVTIKGGTFTNNATSTTSAYGTVIRGWGSNNSIKIEGGDFISNGEGDCHTLIDNNSSKTEISGGRFYAKCSNKEIYTGGNASITGGKYSVNSTKLKNQIASGYAITLNTDDDKETYPYIVGLSNNVEATVTDAEGNTVAYETFAKALEAANNLTSASTIKLNKDITNITTTSNINNTITLDLNGKSMNGSQSPLFNINESKSFTITDTSEGKNGSITGNAVHVIDVNDNSSFILENGTVSSAYSNSSTNDAETIEIKGDSSTITLNGGTLKATGTTANVIVLDSNKKNNTITINNGTFTTDNVFFWDKGNDNKFQHNNKIISNNGTFTTTTDHYVFYNPYITLEIHGGFYNTPMSNYNFGVVSTALNNQTKISGGYFSTDKMLSQNLETGYSVIDTPNTDTNKSTYPKMVGLSSNVVATVTKSDGTTSTYTSLNDAFSNADKGSTIKLNQDSSLTSPVTLSNDITIDLNGKTLSSSDTSTNSALITTNNNVKLTVIDSSTTETKGTIRSDSKTGISLGEGSTLNIEQGGITSTGSSCIESNGSNTSITLKDGTYSSTNGSIVTSNNNSSNNSLLIENGTYTGNDTNELFNNSNTTITITGGNFDSKSKSVVSKDKNNVQISGGQYSSNSNLTTNTLKSGYKVEEQSDETTYKYKVVEDADSVVATVSHIDGETTTTTNYQSLNEAINNASNDDTVTLQKDVTNTDKTTIDKSITLDLNSKTLTSNNSDATVEVSGDTTSITIKNGTLSNSLDGGTSLLVDSNTIATITDNANVGKVKVNGTLNINDGYVDSIDVDTNGSVVISGGSFGFDPTQYVTDTNKVVTKSTTDGKTTYSLIDKTKANVKVTKDNNDYYYETLEAACANADSGSTIQLNDSVTLSTPITISNDGYVLDLNGKTITYTRTDDNSTSAFTISNTNMLTVIDSDSNKQGAINATNAKVFTVGTSSTGTETKHAELSIQAGNITSNSNTIEVVGDYATVDITDGSFTSNGGSVITGGTENNHVYIRGGLYSNGDNHTNSIFDNSSTKYTILGGQFNSGNTAAISTDTKNTQISAGKYSSKTNLTSNTIQTGNAVIDNKDQDKQTYQYIVTNDNSIEASVTSTSDGSTTTTNYESLNEALTYANNNDTVTLNKDVTTDNTTTINKNITLDLNNKTLGTNSGVTVDVESEVTIKNGTISEGPGSSSLTIGTNSKVTLGDDTNPTTVGKITTSGTLDIKKNVTTGNITISPNGSLTLEGGTTGSIQVPEGSSLTIKSGEVSGSISGDGTVIIEGGTFKEDPSNLIDNNNYVVEKETNKDGATAYKVISKSLASVEVIDKEGKSYAYSSLSEAINNATKDSTIKLLKPISTNSHLAIPTDLTIDLNGNTLTYTGNDPFITVSDNVKLTLKDSADNSTAKLNAGSATIANGSTSSSITIENGTYESTSSLFDNNNANVVIEDGKFNSGNHPVITNDKNTAKIKGGKYSSNTNLSENTLDSDYEVTTNTSADSSTYPYTVTSVTDPLVTITTKTGKTKKYSSIKKALEDANDGDTLTLDQDITTDETLTIDDDITLDLGDKTITSTNASPTVSIKKGKKVTIKHGSITNSSDQGASIDTEEDSELTIGNGEEGETTPTTTIGSITTDGTVNITKGSTTGDITGSESSSTNVEGGITSSITTEGSTTVTDGSTGGITSTGDGSTTISGGNVNSFTSTGSSTSSITGGTVGNVTIGKDSSANITGGSITGEITNEGKLTIDGKDTSTGKIDEKEGSSTEVDGGTTGDITGEKNTNTTITDGKTGNITTEGKVDISGGTTGSITGEGTDSSINISGGTTGNVTGEGNVNIAGGNTGDITGEGKDSSITITDGNTGNITTGGSLDINGGNTKDITGNEGSKVTITDGQTGNITTNGSTNVTGGSTGTITTEGDGSANISGGNVEGLDTNGSGTSSFTGGTVGDIHTGTNTNVNITGGTVTGKVTGEGNVNISGGTFTTEDPSQFIKDDNYYVEKIVNPDGSISYKIIKKDSSTNNKTSKTSNTNDTSNAFGYTVTLVTALGFIFLLLLHRKKQNKVN